MLLSEHLHWTPRAWLDHTRISVDNFTDVVSSRVSFSNVERFTGGLGVMVESVHTKQGGELLLRGALDVEQKFGDSKTVTEVSGERLPKKNFVPPDYITESAEQHECDRYRKVLQRI